MSGMRKTLIILVAVFVVLLVLSQVMSRKRLATSAGGGFVQIVPAEIDEASIESIKAWLGAAPDTVVELRRSADGWSVASMWGWPAKKTQMDRLMEDLVGLSGEFRSETDDVLADFQIDDDAGFHIVGEGSGGTEIFHLIAGKSSQRGGSFVRKADSNEVYLTSASFRSSFGIFGEEPKTPEGKRWADLQVFKADRMQVDQVRLVSDGSELILAKEFEMPELPDSIDALPPPDRNNWTWKSDTAGEIDKAKADRVLNAICSLYAADVVDPSGVDTLGLGDGARVGELTMADGTVETLRFGRENEASKRVYFIKDGGMPAEIAKTTVDRVFVSRSDLSPEDED